MTNSVKTNASETSASPSYEKQLVFNAPPEAVFEALTNVQAIRGWWDSWERITGTGTEGGELRFFVDASESDSLVLRVDRALRPSAVAWSVPSCAIAPDWVGTTPTFNLRAIDGGETELQFRHEGLTPQLECYEMCRKGWDQYLPAMQDYVEKRHANSQ